MSVQFIPDAHLATRRCKGARTMGKKTGAGDARKLTEEERADAMRFACGALNAAVREDWNTAAAALNMAQLTHGPSAASIALVVWIDAFLLHATGGLTPEEMVVTGMDAVTPDGRTMSMGDAPPAVAWSMALISARCMERPDAFRKLLDPIRNNPDLAGVYMGTLLAEVSGAIRSMPRGYAPPQGSS